MAKMIEIPSVIFLLVFICCIPAKNNVIGIGSIVAVLFLIEALFKKRNEETPKRNKYIIFTAPTAEK